MPDERERYRQIRRVNFMIRDLNMRRGRPVAFERAELYHDRIVERLSTGEKERA